MTMSTRGSGGRGGHLLATSGSSINTSLGALSYPNLRLACCSAPAAVCVVVYFAATADRVVVCFAATADHVVVCFGAATTDRVIVHFSAAADHVVVCFPATNDCSGLLIL